MSRAVMISIQPKWCELIVNGKKTIEVRKTKPKLETPFKCYIYCTASKKSHDVLEIPSVNGSVYTANGMVIGEFTCDRIYQYSTANVEGIDISDEDMEKMSCLNRLELEEYELSAEAKDFEVYRLGLYCWHISDLKIYNDPLDLFELYRDGLPLIRPPQSWCYVEEI